MFEKHQTLVSIPRKKGKALTLGALDSCTWSFGCANYGPCVCHALFDFDFIRWFYKPIMAAPKLVITLLSRYGESMGP